MKMYHSSPTAMTRMPSSSASAPLWSRVSSKPHPPKNPQVMNRLIKRVLTAFFCIAAIVCHASQFTESDVHQSLRELDRSLSRRNVYKAERNQRIDSLKTLYRVSAGDTLRRLGITIDIARN